MIVARDSVLNRARDNALRFLALSRLPSSQGLPGLAACVDRLKSLPRERLVGLTASSGLHAWLAVAESEVTADPDWFTLGFKTWSGLDGAVLRTFLVDYIDLRIRCLESSEPSMMMDVRFSPSGDALLGLQLAPGIPVNGHLELVSGDPFLLAAFPGVETLERERDSAVLQTFTDTLRLALQRIAQWHAPTHRLIFDLVREVVPCRSSAPPSFPSGSCLATPCAVYLSVTDEVDAVSEMLIHEASHIHLSLMDAAEPLIKGLSAMQAWDEEKWYSPWRDQPRSLMGVLHAIHVFSNVLDYHRCRVEADQVNTHFNASRLTTLHAQLNHAKRWNSFGPWLSDAGRSMLAKSDELTRLSEPLAQQLELNGTVACFAERHRLWRPQTGHVESAIMSHRAWYAQHYRVTS
jgi:hypothetical protein